MINWISVYNGLKINQALFELMRKIRRFSPDFDVFCPKNGDFWTFDAKKSSSYKLFYSVTTYSGGIVACQQESPEKGVTDNRQTDDDDDDNDDDDRRHMPHVKQRGC